MRTQDTPPAAREFLLLLVDDLADWPTALPFGSQRFSLFLVLDGRDVRADDFRAWNTFLERALGQGLAYFSVWGPDCERVHDLMEEELVMRGIDGIGAPFLMTTWHTRSFDEAFEFFANDAVDENYQDARTAPGLIALVGRPDLEPAVLRAVESQKTWRLLQRLRKSRRRFLRKSPAFGILDEFERRRDPSAILGIVDWLPRQGLRAGRAAARVVRALLDEVPGAGLPRFDEMARKTCWDDETWRRFTPKAVRCFRGLGDDGHGLLAVCCSHPSGHVRAQALEQLRMVRSGFELRFLLLRANDWVESVRTAAEAAIRERLTPEYARHFVASIGLVYRLEQGRRGDHTALVDDIERLIREHTALLDGLGAADPQWRRLAYRVALESEFATRAIARGLEEDDPLIRLWSARAARDRLEGDALDHAADRMRRDPFMPVRREGLRAIIGRFPERTRAALEEALLDHNRAVRHEARYHLSKEPGFDAASHYRAAWAAQRDGYAALCGLGETGAAVDLPTMRHALTDPTPRIRWAALAGLVKLSEEVPVDHLLASVQDDSPKVSRLATQLLTAHRPSPDAERLWALWERHAPAHVHRHALQLLEAMPKWTGGALILRATESADGAARAMARAAVGRWLARYNRSFETPSKRELEAFTMAVETAALDERVREDLKQIAGSWANESGGSVVA